MKAQKQGREPGGFSFKALAHQKPLALPLAEHEGFRRGELGCLLSWGFDNPKSTPRFLMSVTSQLRGLFCLRSDTRTRRHGVYIVAGDYGGSDGQGSNGPAGGELAALRTVEFGLGWRVPKQSLTN